MNLSSLIEELEAFSGIRRKQAVGRVLHELRGAWGFGADRMGPGDDAGVLAMEDGRRLLLAADAIVPLLVRNDPYQAGRAAVLVNANDIYAMGGRPLAMVNVMAGLDASQEKGVCHGMRDECKRLCVPMVGGHVSPEGSTPFLAACVLGEAGALLADRNAKPGQSILLAIDLRGERWGDYLLNWDSHRSKDSASLVADLGVLCSVARDGLAVSAKDVSNAGILGSLAMLLENAGLGASVDLGSIEVPARFSLQDWLKVFPSYGFILVCGSSREEDTIDSFQQRGIWAARIGRTDDSRILRLLLGKEEAVFIDFSRKGIFHSKPVGS